MNILGNLVTEISRFVGLSSRDNESNINPQKKTLKKNRSIDYKVRHSRAEREKRKRAGTKNKLRSQYETALDLCDQGSQGDLVEAEKVCSAALILDPENHFGHFTMGYILHLKNDDIGAKAEYEKAIADGCDFEEFSVALTNLGKLHFADGNIFAAQACFNKALLINPGDSIIALKGVAECELSIGNVPNAVTAYSKILELGHSDQIIGTDILLRFAFVHLCRGGDNTIAHSLTLRALKIEPNNSDGHNTLGHIFVHMKKYSEAETEFKKAIKCDPDNQMARHNLAQLKRDPKYSCCDTSSLRSRARAHAQAL